jgi:glycosyltransferase involved in cell wall biosynthesis
MSLTAAILTPSVTGRGGVERFARLLAEILGEDGWTVRLVEPGAAPPRRLAQIGASYAWLGARAADAVGDADLVVGNGFLGRASRRSAARHLHVFHGTMPGSAAATRHGAHWRTHLRESQGGRIAERRASAGATCVAVSRRAAHECDRLLGRPVDAVIPNRPALVHPGVDRAAARAELGLPTNEPIALLVGRAEFRKGLDVAAAGCAAAGWRLAHAGSTAGQPGVDHPLGMLGDERLALAYVAADAVVMPTRYEACSFAMLDALGLGVPLITTDVGWVDELCDVVPEYRELVIDLDATSLAAGLHLVHAEHDRVASIVRRAQSAVHDEFGAERFAARWRSMIDEVMS